MTVILALTNRGRGQEIGLVNRESWEVFPGVGRAGCQPRVCDSLVYLELLAH